MHYTTAPRLLSLTRAGLVLASFFFFACDPVLDTIPAESITISAAGNAASIATDGGTLQMSVAKTEPASSNTNVSWYVTYGTGMASISETGLLTALAEGTVEVFASDGKIVSNKVTVNIGPQTPGWKTYGPEDFDAEASVYAPRIAVAPNGTVYRAYVTSKSVGYSSHKIPTVQKFDGTVWVTLGTIAEIDTSMSTIELSMAVAPDGSVYVAYWIPRNYSSYSNPIEFAISVRRWDGASWVTVGDSLDATSLYNLNMAIAPDGTIYLAYTDGAPMVRRLVGSTWQNIGLPIEIERGAFYSMAIDAGSALYAVLEHTYGSPSLRIGKYSSSAWTTVSVSDLMASIFLVTPSIACDTGGMLYLTTDYEVSRFNGTNWSAVGNKWISHFNFPTLILAGNGTPLIAYYTYENGDTVLKTQRFNGTAWETLGEALKDAYTEKTALAARSDGVPFLAFRQLNSKGSYDYHALVKVYR